MDQAACTDSDPQIFFPDEGQTKQERTQLREQAKAVCSGCPVKKQCREQASARSEKFGVWAGVDRSNNGERKTQTSASRDSASINLTLSPTVAGKRTQSKKTYGSAAANRAARLKRDQTIIAMRAQGHRPPDIARQMQVTERTVYRAISRADTAAPGTTAVEPIAATDENQLVSSPH